MSQFLSWLSMGGYAAYVWPAYGLVCSVLLLNVLSVQWQKKYIQKKLTLWYKR